MVRNDGEANRLDDQAGRGHGGVGLANGFDQVFAAGGGWAQVDDQDLVFFVVNDLGQFRFAAEQVGLGELALKDAVLQMIAPVSQAAKGVTKTLGITHVVGDQVDASHGEAFSSFGRLVDPPCGIHSSSRGFEDKQKIRFLSVSGRVCC